MSLTLFSHKQAAWLSAYFSKHQLQLLEIQPLQEHADHRKYYRITTTQKSIICMLTRKNFDLKKCLQAYNTLKIANLPIAKIYSYDENVALTLLEDLGNTSLLSLAQQLSSGYLYYYTKAIDTLELWQKNPVQSAITDHYDQHKAVADMRLCLTWFINAWGKHHVLPNEKIIWSQAEHYISTIWRQIPTTLCHRDFHADNLFIHQSAIHIIDYQDLAHGPIYYDLASLLTDHYYSHTDGVQQQLINHFLKKKDIPFNHEHYQAVVIQRHIKNLGIFCRLHERDKKSRYLRYLPRLLQTMDAHCKEETPLKSLVTMLTRVYNRTSSPVITA